MLMKTTMTAFEDTHTHTKNIEQNSEKWQYVASKKDFAANAVTKGCHYFQ